MRRWLILLSCSVLLLGSAAGAEEEVGASSRESAPPVTGPGAQEDLVETLRQLAAPDAVHQHLARYAGSWEASGRYWLSDGSTAPVSGTIESTLLHDGLFVESRVEGQLLGEPYEGRAILGYDTTVGELVQVWLDNLGTGIYRYTGTCDGPDCREATFATAFVDPVWGTDMTSRIVVTWLDDDTYTHESWLRHADGREFPQLEYTARRRR